MVSAVAPSLGGPKSISARPAGGEFKSKGHRVLMEVMEANMGNYANGTESTLASSVSENNLSAPSCRLKRK